MAFDLEFLISLGILFQVMVPVYIMVRLVVLNFVFGGTKSFLDACRVHRVFLLSVFERFLRRLCLGLYFL